MQPHKEHRSRTFPQPTIVDAPEQLAEDLPAEGEEDPVEAQDTGELYGVHVSPAADRDLGSREDLGENWIEALEEHAAEGGPMPEHEVTVIDDSDPHDDHPPTDFRDRPKADRGSGGPGGL